MATIDLTTANFDATLDENEIVLLDFWAAWCGPCRAFAPVFERTSQRHPDLVFGKVNIDTQRLLAREFQIRSVPTFMACRRGIVVFAQPGALGLARLENVIDYVRGLDMEKVHADIEAGVEPVRTDGAVV